MGTSVEIDIMLVEDTEDAAPAVKTTRCPDIVDTVTGDIHVDNGLFPFQSLCFGQGGFHTASRCGFQTDLSRDEFTHGKGFMG